MAEIAIIGVSAHEIPNGGGLGVDRTFSTSGDGLEKEWAETITPHMPRYQEFWSRHIVPLTFRDAEDPALKSNFIRPSNHTLYINYADANYAVFFHLSRCFYWLRELERVARAEQYDSNDAIWGTEAIYNIYAHASSAYDSAVIFCVAVNRVLAHFDKQLVAFGIHYETKKDGREIPRRIDEFIGGAGNTIRLCSFVDDIRFLRNQLVHRGIVHLQNGLMPDIDRIKEAQREDLLHHYVGLAAIGVFARDRQKWLNDGTFDRYYRPAVEQTKEHTLALCTNLDPVWGHATSFLDELLVRYPEFGKRSKIVRRDRSLTPEVFKQARSIARPKPKKKKDPR